MRRVWSTGIVLGLALAGVACGGSGGGGGEYLVNEDDPSQLVAQFTPNEPSPGSNSAAMASGGANGNTITVSVNVTDTDDVASTGFDLTYNPTMLEFLGWSGGDLFDPCQPAGSTLCLVDASLAGRLVVAIAATGANPGVDVNGSASAVHVVFRAIQAGSSSLGFDNEALKDSALQDIPGVTWFGGGASAN